MKPRLLIAYPMRQATKKGITFCEEKPKEKNRKAAIVVPTIIQYLLSWFGTTFLVWLEEK
jgi:hypothetical protein